MRTRQVVFLATVVVLICAAFGYAHYRDRHISYDTPMGRVYESSMNIVKQYFAQSFPDVPPPKDFVFVPYGKKFGSGCTGGEPDDSLAYCPGDDKIYGGEKNLQWLYDSGGYPGILIAMGHEYGHHIEKVTGALGKLTDYQSERRADCLGGAAAEFAYQRGLSSDPLGPATIAMFNTGAQDYHGTTRQRFETVQLGATQGALVCLGL